MKQSEINMLCQVAADCLERHQWVLPPQPEWAATDFGLGDYRKAGLVEVLLCNEPEYCEKIMYAQEGMVTPAHTHYEKKEDIICRQGTLRLTLWSDNPRKNPPAGPVSVQINRKMETRQSGVPFDLPAGHRITLTPGLWHEFVSATPECLIGEVSTFCNEETDNIFADPAIDIFQAPEADVPASYPVAAENGLPRALVFDMDGLLLDTEGLYKRAWTQAAKEQGFDLTDALYLKLIGITIADCEVILVEQFGPTFDLESFRSRAASLYDALHQSEGIPLKAGVRELLDWAKTQGLVCVVGTSTKQAEAMERLQHHGLADHFVKVVGGDMVERGKPYPDIFLAAIDGLAIPAGECLVIEDARSGLLAATAGGMRACLVPDLLAPCEESRRLAEGVFASLHAVRSWLEAGCPLQG